MRNKPTNEQLWAKAIWDDAKRRGAIEKTDTDKIFIMSDREAQKCRYTIVNQSMRMAECTVHQNSFTHGVRMFPPHLWNLVGGIVYKKVSGKWERWNPNARENKKRFEE